MQIVVAHKNRMFFAAVDAKNYDWLDHYNWTLTVGATVNYAKGYVEGKYVFMHRLIMNAKPEEYVDHRDNDGLNNLENNLRICTNSQNRANSRKGVGTSQYKGVSWYRKISKWIVSIKVNGHSYYQGSFGDEIEAAKAYDKAAIKFYGEFAKLNFPVELGI